MALHNPDIIPEPFGNFIDRHSTARQQRCKGVTHDMWRHPRRSLNGCVFRKRPAEIVPVKTFPPSRNLGMEHERLFFTHLDQPGQVRLRVAGVDEAVPVVDEDPEPVTDPQIDRGRLDVRRLVGVDLDQTRFDGLTY